MKKAVRNLLVLLNALAALALALSYLSVWVSPLRLSLFAFLGLAFPLLSLANMAFVLLWLWWRDAVAILSSACLAIGAPFWPRSFQINIREPHLMADDAQIKLMSFNVRLFDLYDWQPGEDTRGQIMSLLENEQPDILCLQDFHNKEMPDRESNHQSLSRILDAATEHMAFSQSEGKRINFGIATFSKFPAIGQGTITFQGSDNLCIYTDLATPLGVTRVYNCHLQSIKLSQNDYNLIDSLEYKSQEQLRGLVGILLKLQLAFQLRAQQADAIANHLRHSPYPALVCGDFNDTPVSYTYQTLTDQLMDAFVEGGNGFEGTYNGLLPAFRIDYLLHDTLFEPYGFRTIEQDLSDHFPLTCHFRLRQAPPTP